MRRIVVLFLIWSFGEKKKSSKYRQQLGWGWGTKEPKKSLELNTLTHLHKPREALFAPDHNPKEQYTNSNSWKQNIL